MGSKKQSSGNKGRSKVRLVKVNKTVIVKKKSAVMKRKQGKTIMRGKKGTGTTKKNSPDEAQARFKHNASNNQSYESFDKITHGGWIDCSLELGLLKRIKDKENTIIFEFELNDKKIDAWSSKKGQWGLKNKQLLKEGYRYILKGTMKAKLRNKNIDKYSTSDFKFNVMLANVEVEFGEKLHNVVPVTNDFVTLKHIKERIDFGKPFDDLKVQNVEILAGDVRRYMGCEDCFTGLSTPNKNGNYYCNLCKKKTKSRKKKERIVCIIIRNIELKDKDGNILKNVLCFQRQCEILFGGDIAKCLKSHSDMDARNTFETMIGSKLNVTIKYELPNGSSSSSRKGYKDSKIIIGYLEVTEKIHNPKVKLPTSNSLLTVSQTVIVTGRSRCPCEEEAEIDEDDDDETNPASSSSSNLSGEKNMLIPFTLDTTGEEHYELQQTKEGHIGLAIIINMNFKSTPKPRRGSNVDVDRLQKLLPSLGVRIFRGEALQDINKKKFEDHVNNFKKELINGGYSSMFFIIMSHGSLFTIRLEGDTCLNIYKDIKPLFGEANFPQFRGKPKIFVFNACQAFVDSKGLDIDDTQIVPDVLECFPCEPGIKAKRSSLRGSYFIQTMADVFETFYNTHHIEKMMKIVQERMREIRLGERKTSINIPEYKPKLFGKSFYFKRNLPSIMYETNNSLMDAI